MSAAAGRRPKALTPRSVVRGSDPWHTRTVKNRWRVRLRPAGCRVLTAVVLAATIVAAASAQDAPQSGNGPATIDLRDEWSDGPRPTPLDGQWDFYWRAFDIPESATRAPDARVAVPGGWQMTPELDLPLYGFATYRTLVELPPTHEPLALWISQIAAAATVRWNGLPVFRAGTPGQSREEETPEWSPRVVILPDVRERNTITVEVSNFRDISSGITYPIEIGPADELFVRQQRELLGSVFIAGVLAIMSVFHLLVFGLRRNDHATLWFGVMLGVFALRVLVINQLPLVQLAGSIPYGILMRISYITYPLAAAAVLQFVASLMPEDTWRTAQRIVFRLAVVMGAFIVVAPVQVFIRATAWFHPVTLAGAVVIVGTLVNAVRRRRESAWLFAAGIAVLIVAALHDILAALALITTPAIVPVAMLVFILIESVVLARNHALALFRAERFSEAVGRFVPSEMLRLIGVPDVTTVRLGQVAELDMTVLFLDIRGFTPMAERLGPQDSYALVNRFLGVVGPIVRGHGGVVEKYLGDGLLALFSSAAAAVRAAIELRRARATLNERIVAIAGQQIDYGIGVHTGLIMLGTVGEIERMDTSSISDTVNVGSRIEGLTKRFGVGLAVSSDTYREVEDSMRNDARFLGKLSIRGKKQAVSVFEVFSGEESAIITERRATMRDFEQGVISYFLDDYDEAADAFARVLEHAPGDAASHHYLSLVQGRIEPGAAAPQVT